MFDNCPKRDNKICAFCTIEYMKACPLDSKKKRVTTLTNWNII